MYKFDQSNGPLSISDILVIHYHDTLVIYVTCPI
jgi:hypothetical protein